MHGFIYRAPEPEDYKQDGPVRLGGPALQANGQWDAYLPQDEFQAQYTETAACATFGTLNCVEILERNVYGDSTNWSDRFLAKIARTTKIGNDPHTVAETLRKQGTVYETDWPYTPDLTTWDAFYTQPPFDLEVQAQVKFKGRYSFGHQYVKTDPASMMTALMFSPLGASVYAWNAPENGIYYRKGMPSTHWICIYGYEKGKYWKCFDSYDNTHKKLDWNFGFTMVKQYTLDKTVVQDTPWWKAILYFLGLHPNWL